MSARLRSTPRLSARTASGFRPWPPSAKPTMRVRVYERRLSDEPHSVGAHRCLAPAYVAAGAFEQAAGVVDRGRDLGPDAGLLDLRGDALACQGRSEDALATWS